MKIDIQYTLDELEQTLKNDIERRLRLAFSKVEAHISSIIFIISKVDKKDKEDGNSYKHCSLTISLNRISNILIEDTQKGLNNTINRVIQKASRIIYRNIFSGKNEEL
jgi:hypothetical protein